MKKVRISRLGLWSSSILILVLAGSLAYVFLPGQGNIPELPAPDYWPTDGWRVAPPESQGFDSAALANGLQAFGQDFGIDSLLVVRNGYVVLDAYFYPYDGSFPHDVASVAKSFTTALVGIAVGQGKLQLDQPVISFFPERSIANLDDRKKSMTVRDLVSMQNGMESGCISRDEATLDIMRSSPDWVQAALDRPVVHQPGTHFCYDSPGMHLLSAILQQATGMTELEYARQVLFEPLGIHDVIWEADPQGYTHGWGDLHIKPEDAAKLGLLWLQRGMWDGQQIIPTDWTSQAVRAHSRLVGTEYGYGYGWWVSPVDFYALGREGQYIRVIPSLNTVVVLTGGGYDDSQVTSFLIKILIQANRVRPSNPAAAAELDRVLAELKKGSIPKYSSSLPGTAMAISGKDYACETNPAGITRLRLDFDSSQVAELSLKQNSQEVAWQVGLDGKFRLSSDGQAQRGYWEDEQTFVLEQFDIGDLLLRLHFNGDKLEIDITEAGITLKCEMKK